MKLFADKRVSFPNPEHTLEDGLLEMSDNLSVDRLLEAYSFGIFPWPYPGFPTLWFSPPERGVIDFADFHIPRSLAKLTRKCAFEFSFDRAFPAVLEACASQARPGQQGTWITDKIRDAYTQFHRAGYAHSLEVWREGELIGGLYGVYVGGVFCGESMYYVQPNASKLAVWKIVEFLKSNGLLWMDIQMVTPVLELFGGKYISRKEYLARLVTAKQQAHSINFQF